VLLQGAFLSFDAPTAILSRSFCFLYYTLTEISFSHAGFLFRLTPVLNRKWDIFAIKIRDSLYLLAPRLERQWGKTISFYLRHSVMSDRIEQTLEILREVQSNYNESCNPDLIVEFRRRATESIARKRAICYATVSDKFRNQLKPEIQNTHEFDQLVISWLREGSPVLYNILIDHAVSGEDTHRIETFFGFHQRGTTDATVFPAATDPLPERPITQAREKRLVQEDYRVIPLRDTLVARFIKQLYGHRCQICGTAIRLPSGEIYAEAHHIKPLEDSGPDLPQNVLCLCPNHHVALDYRAIRLDMTSLEIHPQHQIESRFIEYHNTRIESRSFSPPFEPPLPSPGDFTAP
jgi:hypothetical protein